MPTFTPRSLIDFNFCLIVASACRICQFWNYESRIGINTYSDYQVLYNIANLYNDNNYCGKNCSRICCNSEIKDFVDSKLSMDEYEAYLSNALNMTQYYPFIYEKAVISELKLGKSQFIFYLMQDSVFDNLLNKQKLEYLRSLGTKLNSEQKNAVNMLEMHTSYDDFSYKYKRIFGNNLQILALGLMNDNTRVNVLHRVSNPRIKIQVISFLGDDVINDFVENSHPQIRHVALAKLPIEKKLKYLEKNHHRLTDKDQIALMHDLPTKVLENTNDFVEKYNIGISGLLKIISQIRDAELLTTFSDHKNPYIRAYSLYLLSSFQHQYYQEYRSYIDEKIIDLMKYHPIFIPVDNFEQNYYQILMEEPDHNLSGFLINYISDKKLLKKLLFLTQLREQVKDRLKFLEFLEDKTA